MNPRTIEFPDTAQLHDVLGALHQLEFLSTHTLKVLRSVPVSESLAMVSRVIPTPELRDALRRTKYRAERLGREVSGVYGSLEDAIHAAEQAAGLAKPRTKPWSRAAPAPTGPPAAIPLLTCPICGDLALALDPADPVGRRGLERSLKKVRTVFASLRRDFRRRQDVRYLLTRICPAQVSGDLDALHQSKAFLAALKDATSQWCRAAGEALDGADRAHDRGEFPAFVVGLRGLVEATLREPCAHLVQIRVAWCSAVRSRMLSGDRAWTRPGWAATGDTAIFPQQQWFQIDNSGAPEAISRFVARGFALFSREA